ncbi:MAG: PDZ domain-containing protein [Acidimicrobiales bacterium]
MKVSQSERAGLKAGDVLVSVGGQKPTSLKDLMARLATASIGEELEFVILRGGQEKTTAVRGWGVAVWVDVLDVGTPVVLDPACFEDHEQPFVRS